MKTRAYPSKSFALRSQRFLGGEVRAAKPDEVDTDGRAGEYMLELADDPSPQDELRRLAGSIR
jgi:hypothetical protein